MALSLLLASELGTWHHHAEGSKILRDHTPQRADHVPMFDKAESYEASSSQRFRCLESLTFCLGGLQAPKVQWRPDYRFSCRFSPLQVCQQPQQQLRIWGCGGLSHVLDSFARHLLLKFNRPRCDKQLDHTGEGNASAVGDGGGVGGGGGGM